MFRTYVVGDNSLVKRLDNHTLPWVDLTSTLFPNLQMQSILILSWYAGRSYYSPDDDKEEIAILSKPRGHATGPDSRILKITFDNSLIQAATIGKPRRHAARLTFAFWQSH